MSDKRHFSIDPRFFSTLQQFLGSVGHIHFAHISFIVSKSKKPIGAVKITRPLPNLFLFRRLSLQSPPNV